MTHGDPTGEEVSYSDFLRACGRLEVAAKMLREGADPDSAALHWLPQITAQIALIFSFIGSNMTARHVPRYLRTMAEYEAAKDVTNSSASGRLPGEPTTGGNDGQRESEHGGAEHGGAGGQPPDG